MFKLSRIIGYNFWLFKEFDIDFSSLKSNDIVFVQGINHDATDAKSNWSGKTTLIIDFFRWVYEDKYPRLQRVNDAVGKFDTYTFGKIIYIDSNNNKLCISRYRNHPKYKNSFVIKWMKKKIVSDRKVDTIAMLYKILGITPMQLISGVLFTNEPEDELLLKLPSVRNKELAEIWNITSFDDAAKLATKVCTEIDKKVYNLNGKIDILNATKKKIKSNISNYKNDLKEHRHNKKNKLKKIQDKIDGYNNIVNNGNILHKKIVNDENKLVDIENAISELKKRAADTVPINNKINKIRTNITLLNEKNNMISKDINDLKIEVRNIRNDLKEGIICDSCGNEVTNKSKDKLISHRKQKIKKLKTQRDVIATDIVNERNKMKIQKKKLDDYDIKDTDNQINILSNTITKLHKRIEHNKSMLLNIDKIKKEIKELESEHNEVSVSNSNIKKRLRDEKIELANISSEIVSLTERCKKFTDEFNLYKYWSGPNGFKLLRNYVLNTKVELMSNEFSKHLDSISDGSISGEWKVLDSGDIVCELYDTIVGQEKHFKGFSWAQRTKILFAQLLASASIYAPNMGHINIDEKVDAGMDSVGVERLLHYVQNSSMGKIIFLTSHLTSINQYCAATLRIERRKNTATAALIS